jgi:hypothetical protein
MANRYPLIIDAAQNQIQELSSGDNLDMSGSGIVNLSVNNLKVSGGTSGQVISTDGSGNLSFTNVSASPAGANTQVQYNNAGSLGASATFTFNNVNNTLTVSNLSAGNIALSKYNETVVSGGNTGASTIAPDAAQGTIYTYTATGNFTLNGLNNAVAGTSMTIIITQDGSGNKTMTSTMKFAGGSKTLSTAANAIDVISVFYDGTTYYASLTKGYA